MIAKCIRHNLVYLKKMRKTCPDCGSKLSRPSLEELKQLGESAMDKSRAIRCLIETNPSANNKAFKLASFMAIFHGHHMSLNEAERMLS